MFAIFLDEKYPAISNKDNLSRYHQQQSRKHDPHPTNINIGGWQKNKAQQNNNIITQIE